MLNAYYSDNTVLNAFYMYISRICKIRTLCVDPLKFGPFTLASASAGK